MLKPVMFMAASSIISAIVFSTSYHGQDKQFSEDYKRQIEELEKPSYSFHTLPAEDSNSDGSVDNIKGEGASARQSASSSRPDSREKHYVPPQQRFSNPGQNFGKPQLNPNAHLATPMDSSDSVQHPGG